MNKFCKAISGYYSIPNIFEFFIDKNLIDPPFEQAIKIGIESSVLLINIGSELTLLLTLLISWPLLRLIYSLKILYLNKKLDQLLGLFKYSVFIRFWLQNHLIIGIYSLINLKLVKAK